MGLEGFRKNQNTLRWSTSSRIAVRPIDQKAAINDEVLAAEVLFVHEVSSPV